MEGHQALGVFACTTYRPTPACLAVNPVWREEMVVMDPGIKTPRSDERSDVGSEWAQIESAGEARESGAAGTDDAAEIRAQLERLRQREAQIMNLIGCKNPEKLMHDLRNVLNELQLLRMLADTDKS